MARSRNIKPGFFRCPELLELDPLARLLFAGLWTIADRSGRLEDRPMKIKVEVLPADNCDVDALLSKLHEKELILRYAANGNRYICLPAWLKHQNPHVKEMASTIPPPDKSGVIASKINHKSSASTVSAPDQNSSNTSAARLIPDSLNLIPDSLENASGDARPGEPFESLPTGGSADASEPTPKRKPYQDVLEQIAANIHGRHPNSDGAARRRDLSVSAVEKLLQAIVKHKHLADAESEAYLRRVDRNHAACCESEAWRKDGGQFVKSLRGWLAPREERYDVAPDNPARSEPVRLLA